MLKFLANVAPSARNESIAAMDEIRRRDVHRPFSFAEDGCRANGSRTQDQHDGIWQFLSNAISMDAERLHTKADDYESMFLSFLWVASQHGYGNGHQLIRSTLSCQRYKVYPSPPWCCTVAMGDKGRRMTIIQDEVLEEDPEAGKDRKQGPDGGTHILSDVLRKLAGVVLKYNQLESTMFDYESFHSVFHLVPLMQRDWILHDSRDLRRKWFWDGPQD